ncbi:hypothetical protein ABZ498_33725 [Streptomyces lavendulocolor]|uniref:hypothetical protein n=1 Tax=Streptomyces lavendulocolor TaxID=67316 RepID=UPI0033E42834
MPATRSQTAALVGMLRAATGTEPTVHEESQHVRIEADLPDDLGPAERRAVLIAIAACPRYGHDRTSKRVTIWAELDKEAHR